MNQNNDNIRRISVETWHDLALVGGKIPVKITLAGDSMRPLIRRDKDKVTILPLSRPVKKGDIVLFAYPNGRYVVHRVWKCSEDRVITLGDHCTKPDAPLETQSIWGIVTKVERADRLLPVDTPLARGVGRVWMALLPLRKGYYKIRNRSGSNRGCKRKPARLPGPAAGPTGCEEHPGLPPVSGGASISGCKSQRKGRPSDRNL